MIDGIKLLELIQRRQSDRKYNNRPVEPEKLERIIEAGRMSPSACNSQPWKFIIVDDKELKDRLCHAAFSGMYSVFSFAKKAPVIVVVVSERAKFIARVGGLFRGIRFYLIDIGIATEHFVLQAEELGLGTCWLGWFNEGAVKSMLNVPKDRKVDVLLALGYYDRAKLGKPHDREPIKRLPALILISFLPISITLSPTILKPPPSR